MSQSIILDVKGIHTYASEVSGVPQGSLAVASNVNISRQGIIEPRRGYDLLAYGLPNTLDRPKKLIFWNDTTFCHYGTTFSYDTGSAFGSKGSLTTPTNSTSVRSVSSRNKNLYLTSSLGLYKTDAISTAIYAAGIPKGLNIGIVDGGAGTAIAGATSSITYRYLLGRKDANGNTQFGGVSGRFTYTNASGTNRNTTVTCYIPSGLDATYFLQLYKSVETTSTATNDELQLCYETVVSATDVSNGYVTVTDIVPDALLGATIYTASSQQGLVNDNTRPPLAQDIAEYKGCMFYADVESRQRFSFSLISNSGTGLTAGDTVTITPLGGTAEVYTAHATTFNAATKQFIAPATVGSVGIDTSIKSLIKCINAQSSGAFYAYSMSESATDLPGKCLIESRTLGSVTFTVISSRATAFQPQLPTTATINNTSSSDSFKNAIMFSKPDQPEAVPIKNIFYIGASDDRIKRIVALRDGLFIFKARDGVSVLRGEDEQSFKITLLDNTAKLVAPDSVVTVNNLVYGLFEAGICEVSDTGVSIISIPIKDQLLPLYGAPLTALKAYSFGISNDTDGKYILSLPSSSTDTYATKQFIFDTFGRTFCTWDLPLTCGAVNPLDQKLYLGQGTSNYLKKERKAFDHTDYADYGQTCTVSSYSTTTLTISGSSLMAAGDILYQSDGSLAYIESVNANAGTVVIDSAQTWSATADATIHMKAINCKVQWNPDFAGNAAGFKQYYECALISKQAFQKTATLYFSSDINPSEASISIDSASGNGAWGEFTWGDEVWGGEQAKAPKRLGIPRGHSRCSQLNVRFENKIAYSDFQLTGLSLSFNPVSTRTTR